MNFQISDELKEKIEMNVKYDIDLKNKLLSGDGNAIKQIGIESQKRINPVDVVEAYESNNMEYLYNLAKKRLVLNEIYNELCNAYASKMSPKENNGFGKRM